MKKFLGILLFVILFFSFASAQYDVLAQSNESDRTEGELSVVYTLRSYYFGHYVGTFSPTEKNDIYLLAGTENFISTKKTMIYFWPIDQEYKVDWAKLNEAVGTKLLITPANGETMTIDLTPVLFDVSNEGVSGYDIMLKGDEAGGYYQAFLNDKERYLQSMAEYDRAYAAYLDSLSTESPIPAPDKPDTFTRMLTPPSDGFVVNLPAGKYHACILDQNGKIIPNSNRNLVVIAPRRSGINFTVIPESQWTQPSVSMTSEEMIFVSEDEAIYLSPYFASEYLEQDIARLKNPQVMDVEPGKWVWVRTSNADLKNLKILSNNLATELVEIGSYVVKQSTGARLGYEIIEMPEDHPRKADIEGFLIDTKNSASNKIELIALDQDMQAIETSRRTIVLVKEELPLYVYLLPVLPIAISAIFQSLRKKAKDRIEE